MNRRILRQHKAAKKILPSAQIEFKKGVRLPPPLNEVIRSKSRTETTKLIKVSNDHYVCFLWRNGEVRIKSAFYGWLLYQKAADGMVALASLHYHPSHKPAHLVTRCEKDKDDDLRALGRDCPELNLGGAFYDPRSANDRYKLIEEFCYATGIEIITDGNYDTPASQSLDLRPL